MAGRVASLHRYPVKGFTPERLDEVRLQAGAYFPCDRIYAVERGACGFDAAAPQHLSKWRFAVLANHARIARAVTAFDEATGVLTVSLDGAPTLRADLFDLAGREAFAGWLAGFLGEHEDEALRLIDSGPAHRFTDDRDGAVSIINLRKACAPWRRASAHPSTPCGCAPTSMWRAGRPGLSCRPPPARGCGSAKWCARWSSRSPAASRCTSIRSPGCATWTCWAPCGGISAT